MAISSQIDARGLPKPIPCIPKAPQFEAGGYQKWVKIGNDGQSVTRGPAREGSGRVLGDPVVDFSRHLGSEGRAAEDFGRHLAVQLAARTRCFLNFWRCPYLLIVLTIFKDLWAELGDNVSLFFIADGGPIPDMFFCFCSLSADRLPDRITFGDLRSTQ